MVLAVVCSFGLTAFGQTLVSDFTGFDAAFQPMKIGGGAIELTADVTITLPAGGRYDLSATSPVVIDTKGYKLTLNGPNATGTAVDNDAIFTIGNGVTITGVGATTNARVLEVGLKATLQMTGGKVELIRSEGECRTIFVLANSRMEMSGGEVIVDVSASTGGNHMMVNADNAGTVFNATGGTLTGITAAPNAGRQIRGLRLAATSTADLSGITINITGSTANNSYAIHTDGKVEIGSGVTINAPVCLQTNNANTAYILMDDASNVSLTASITNGKYGGAGGIFDLSNLPTISADPVSSTTFPTPTGDVTLTVQGGNPELTSLARIYCTTDGSNPTGASGELLATNGKIQVIGGTTTIKACVGGGGYLATALQDFTYTTQMIDPANPIFLVTTFAELQQAFTDSQLPIVVTATINLGASITATGIFDMVAAPEHKVTINSGANKLNFNGTTTLGGNLFIYGSGALIDSSNGTITFEGGTYQTSTTTNLIHGAGNTGATIIINAGTFSVPSAGNSSRGIQLQSAASKLIFNGGTLNVGNTGRAIHLNPGSAEINGGSITMGGTGNGSQLIRIDNNTACNVDINGGTLNAGGGYIVGYAGAANNGTVVVRDGNLTTTGSALYLKNAAPTGSQLIYDFRAYTITPSVPAGKITGTQSVILGSVDDGTSVDAASADIVYTTDGTDPTATSAVYASAISVSAGTTIKAAMMKDGFIGEIVEFAYTTTTNFNDDVKAGFAPYISNNTLYLPELSSVSIFNLSGQVLLNASDAKTLDVSSLPNGIYLVKSAQGIFKVKK